MDSPWNSPDQNTGVGCLSLLQGIFPIQRSNLGVPHCKRILYQLSHQGSPRILEWVTYPFSSGSSWPRDLTGVSCIAGGFFTSWATRKALFFMKANVSYLMQSHNFLFTDKKQMIREVTETVGGLVRIQSHVCLITKYLYLHESSLPLLIIFFLSYYFPSLSKQRYVVVFIFVYHLAKENPVGLKIWSPRKLNKSLLYYFLVNGLWQVSESP